ncbi:MAG: type II secretion system F family protein [Lachnospiraceae bacterium]|nr:type II secretion system F family protein [Lachnospiraceae bacterium]
MKQKKELLTVFSLWLYEKGKTRIRSGKVREDLLYINRREPIEEAERNYYVTKIKISLLILFAALFITLVLLLQARTENRISTSHRILRSGKGGARQELLLEFEDEDGIGGEAALTLEAVHYTEEELEEIYPAFEESLSRKVLGENETFGNVTESLSFPEKLEGYPFFLTWESGNYLLLGADGKISEDALKTYLKEEARDYAIVSVTANITYDGFVREKVFSFRLYPPLLSREEAMASAVEEELALLEQENRTEKEYVLPDQIGGKNVTFREKKESMAVPVFFLIAAAAVGVFFLSDVDLSGKAGKRQEKLMEEYADFASRLALYLTSGLTVRGAFFRIAADYGGRIGDPIAEEVQQSCREMESGMSETLVYDRFGKRCRGSSYRRLSGLLIQNLKKGSSSLALLLQMETQEAFEERKRSAKAKGEEAGTRMLAPMMMLLVVVMAMILIPAFLSFS